MELRVRDSNKIIDVDFGAWLSNRIKIKLLSNSKKYNFVHWDKYLSESETLKRLYKKDYKAMDVIVFASKNIVCKGTDGEISITFDNTKFVPGFDRLPLVTLVKTINYGTQDSKGCPIFTDTFNYFVKNLDTYVGMYYSL